MEGDREPPTVLIICSAMPEKGISSWHEWWMEMSLGVITSNQNRNDKVSSASIQGHQHKKNPRLSTQVQAKTITALLQKFKLKVLGHPPYTPDLSPCDYSI